MNITILILSILKQSKDLGKESMQIQNIDHILGRKGERNIIGSKLSIELEELVKNDLIYKFSNNYSLTKKGLQYLEKNK